PPPGSAGGAPTGRENPPAPLDPQRTSDSGRSQTSLSSGIADRGARLFLAPGVACADWGGAATGLLSTSRSTVGFAAHDYTAGQPPLATRARVKKQSPRTRGRGPGLGVAPAS